ncbi:hypothetical protein CTT31_20775 [Pseudoalteromonas maricaloris]|uniref:hypothetical protein n=1 Tax=Pseudoalteromonas maricaloris TaxID=184924 RepID=UPI0021AD9DEE|nr:hypothetical protein [Pseudoalteromonas flavipulchra]USE71520.1 hypothetical protein CTT31_20775 [Pseudoalteromonas flavipulchra]
MAIPGLIRNFAATSEIKPNRIVAVSVGDFMAAAAAGVADNALGVTEQGTDNHLRVDVVMDQIAPVELGGDFDGGEWAVSDADGRAIPFDKATFAEDDTINVVGKVLEAGDAGTIADIHVTPFLIVK